ncbi:2-dehydropantoate 2-reductase [Psychrobacillus psychrodurans]|uniref:2-dehydropantoate 2-reductase n=1 Tax=Psychrobacillus psychrodurans TaxID=126157 RepID=A0A9X3L7N6_9BACI|nr:2-dehydropantoate 2-reductase [Psychrobacillus psychrodurans]MCZ8532883.1 2-dehydropantoate 2-reductase [Psychrobacillus psychrodurans]
MNIGIVGAGAIGLLFGAYFSEAGHRITFLVRETNGSKHLYIEKSNENRERIVCEIVSDIADLQKMDLIIIAVKYHHLKQLKDQLNSLPLQIPLLFIQNGLSHIDFLEQLQQDTILIGSVLHGATKKNNYTVQHLGVGPTYIGFYKGEWHFINNIVEKNNDKFPMILTPNIEQMLVKKAMLNCLINPLTTIACVTNGELINNDSYKVILRSMYNEMMEAFEEWKETLTWDEVVALCENTGSNRSSMLKDFENGRMMELDTIVGAILERATLRKKTLPILQAFYLLLSEINKEGDYNR